MQRLRLGVLQILAHKMLHKEMRPHQATSASEVYIVAVGISTHHKVQPYSVCRSTSKVKRLPRPVPVERTV